MKEYKTFMEGKVLEKRRNVVNHRTTEYQYGSAVRKLQSVPEIHTYEHERRIEEQEQERRQRRREIRRNNRVNLDRKSTRLNSSHNNQTRMPSSA